jgi:hypothetical protein
MKEELKTLSVKMDEMQKDIRKYQDLDSIKTEGSERQHQLQVDSVSLEQKTKTFGEAFKAVQQEHEKLKVLSDLVCVNPFFNFYFSIFYCRKS